MHLYNRRQRTTAQTCVPYDRIVHLVDVYDYDTVSASETRACQGECEYICKSSAFPFWKDHECGESGDVPYSSFPLLNSHFVGDNITHNLG